MKYEIFACFECKTSEVYDDKEDCVLNLHHFIQNACQIPILHFVEEVYSTFLPVA